MTIAERVRDYVHPLLAELRDSLVDEVEFWARVASNKTPLIESDPSSPKHSLVTYVFCVPPEAHHVVVMPGFAEHEPASNVMTRLGGTATWHATYRYRNDVRTSYSFRADLPLIAWDSATEAEMKRVRAFLAEYPPQQDPHHRESFVTRMGPGVPNKANSFLSLPSAPDESLAYKRPNVPRGRIDAHTFKSNRMGNERRVWVYTPPSYELEMRNYPVLVAFDGAGALSFVPVHRIIDNLLAERRIGPVVAILIDNPTDTSRNDELPCNEDFACFVELELLPWVHARYRVSHAPEDHFVTGMSYGGLAAMWMGFRLPHIFGNVISQAASLWWGPGYRIEIPRYIGGYQPEWLIDQYERSPHLPVRFWVEIGLMEHPALMLESNRRMKAVLEAKGYDLTHCEPAGGHDTALWRGTLADALTTMLPTPRV